MSQESMNRPHPCPLPRERENRALRFVRLGALGCRANDKDVAAARRMVESPEGIATFPLSSGERAGVRADYSYSGAILAILVSPKHPDVLHADTDNIASNYGLRLVF